MPRSRMVKPETFSDAKLSKVSIQARYLFVGLWVFSDDFGVVKGSPKWISSQVFEEDESVNIKDVKKWVSELVGIGVLQHFRTNDKDFYFIKSWEKHQKVSHPSEKYRNPYPTPEDLQRVSRESLATYTLNEDVNENVNVNENEHAVVVKNTELESEFENIWKQYPNKEGKSLALKAFLKTVNSPESLKNIWTAIKNYGLCISLAHKSGFDRKVKNGAAWFNTWQDWLEWTPPPEFQVTEKATRENHNQRMAAEALKNLTGGQYEPTAIR